MLQDQLRRAYEILLGHPLASFDPKAHYELWFSVEHELLSPEDRAESLALEQLVVVKPDAPASTHDREHPDFWMRYAVDYAHTLFVYDKHDLGDAPHDLVEALQARHYALTGEEIGRLVAKAGLDVRDVLARCWYACRRAVTDGTLEDAMAAATLSTAAPHWLLSREQYDAMADNIRFEPRWEHALAGIEDDALREHLLMSCVDLQTARWAGSWFDPKRRPDVWLEPVTRRGGEILAIWHSGEGRTRRAVVKFAHPAAPVMVELSADDSTALMAASDPAAPAKKPRTPKRAPAKPRTRRKS